MGGKKNREFAYRIRAKQVYLTVENASYDFDFLVHREGEENVNV